MLSEPIGGFLVWTVHCHTLTSLAEQRFLSETKLLQQQSQMSLQTLTANGVLLANVSSFKICKSASSDKGLPILNYDWKLLDKKTNKRLHQNSFFCWNSLDLHSHLSQTLNTDALGSGCFCLQMPHSFNRCLKVWRNWCLMNIPKDGRSNGIADSFIWKSSTGFYARE